jgi:hypothetical protein
MKGNAPRTIALRNFALAAASQAPANTAPDSHPLLSKFSYF